MKYSKEDIEKMIDMAAELKHGESMPSISDEELEKRKARLKNESSLELLELAFNALFSDSEK